MTELVLLILADAFRWDYVPRTNYIRRIARRSITGALEEDLGFLPQAAYFGGLTPNDVGFTNMYSCDPDRSPFGLARGLPASADDPSDVTGARQWLDRESRKRVTPFAASYLTSAAIPLALLPWFDVVEKRAHWDPAVGYASIFNRLRSRGEGFFCCGWPETNMLADRSDAALVARTLEHVRPTDRLAFVHLQQLDAIGHAYGPESAEILRALDETDALVERLVTQLSDRFDRLHLILFGDHGMVPVTGTTDIARAIASTGLVAGRDVVYFLDSTMARFWFPSGAGRSQVERALAPLPGRLLDARDYRRFHAEHLDPRNGELIFLVDPGVLIAPNFFQRRGEHPRGMHGYEPACPDNRGVFLVHEHGRDSAAEVGVVRPTRIHQELGRLLFETDGPRRGAREVGADACAVSRLTGTFTQHPDPAAHAMLREHVHQLVHETLRIVPDPQAILLTGSFGRDEGGVMARSGQYVPVNDYDILVVSKRAGDEERAALAGLGHALARWFGLDFVHFSVWPDMAPGQQPTLANYDVRHGSRVLWGDETILNQLPRFAAADLPAFEGLELVWNRLAGLLTGMRWPLRALDGGGRRYLVNQVMKARMALGDWQLIRHRAYDASYATRLERFAWLATGLACPYRQRTAVMDAYRYKLRPDDVRVGDLDECVRDTIQWLLEAVVSAAGYVAKRATLTPGDAARAYLELVRADPEAIARDNDYAARMLAGWAGAAVTTGTTVSVRHSIYAALPLVAAAFDGDERAFADATSGLARCLAPEWPSTLTPENWEAVRARVSGAWLRLVH